MKSLLLPALAALVAGAAPAPKLLTPPDIVDAAASSEWHRFDPQDLLLIDLADGSRVTIALAPAFAPAHAANIRALVRARWYDGGSIYRVQDNYVVQWGHADGSKPLPSGLAKAPAAEFERPSAGLPITPLPYRDAFAPLVGYSGAFPVAAEGGRAWMAHCYGMVGVGRDLMPDTGNGTELYAVSGHSPRQLDRNIALVGRVLDGFEHMTALQRGSGTLGFYEKDQKPLGIAHVRLAADLPADERPAFEWLKPTSTSFAKWLHLRANRKDAFYFRPAGAIDLCGGMPPVRPAQPSRDR